MSLIRLYGEYISKDLPDKEYKFEDFTDKGPRSMLSGYYSGRIGDQIFIWTYSGLKRFKDKPGTSVYYFHGICSTIESIKQNSTTDFPVIKSEPSQLFDINLWEAAVKKGDYVRLKRVGEGKDRDIIDKIWATDNQNYPYGGVTRSECQKR